jgi:hypothetical protein
MKTFLSLAHCVTCLSAAAADSHVVRVVQGATGKMMPNAQLRSCELPSPGWGKRFKSVVADGRGWAEIAVKPGGSVYVEAVEPGWVGRPVLVGKDATNSSNSSNPIEIKLWPGTKVTGRILEPNGEPAANAQITAGVYFLNGGWKKRFGIDLAWMSWDHGDWPNWQTVVTTGTNGRFQVTVPPREARSWIRLGTTTLSFGSSNDVGMPQDSKRLAARFAPFEHDFEPANHPIDGVDVGDIQLERGVVLEGKVVDSKGEPMPNVHLLTSGRHGPYGGRRTITNERGEYRFLPHAPGDVTISVDARHRDENGKVKSRDVRAIFSKLPVTLSEDSPDLNVLLQAREYVTLKFNWVDRRQPPIERISHYNHMPITGHVEVKGKLQYWRGGSQRNGSILFLKVPVGLQNAKLVLPNDKYVTISYEDETGLTGKGRMELPNLDPKLIRTIYGDPPRASK